MARCKACDNSLRIAELDASPEGMTRPQGDGHGRPESNPEE